MTIYPKLGGYEKSLWSRERSGANEGRDFGSNFGHSKNTQASVLKWRSERAQEELRKSGGDALWMDAV